MSRYSSNHHPESLPQHDFSAAASSSSRRNECTFPPITTACIFALCTVLYFTQTILLPTPLHRYTMCPRLILFQNEWYRVFTSSLFHANPLHLAVNMLSTVPIGSMLERQGGSLWFLLTTLWAIPLISCTYLFLAYMYFLLTSNDNILSQHSVGFSGVLFYYLVLECHGLHATGSSGSNATRSLFGIVTVPIYLYPYALLVALQFILPNLSLLGHLSGIITGTLHVHGGLTLLLPKSNTLLRMQDVMRLPPVQMSNRGYSSCPTYVPVVVMETGAASFLSNRAPWNIPCSVVRKSLVRMRKSIDTCLVRFTRFFINSRADAASSTSQNDHEGSVVYDDVLVEEMALIDSADDLVKEVASERDHSVV